jgi:hypothetical protein
MKSARLSRVLHKWLGLLIGVQLLLWTTSGFYMVAVHIDFIHGDMLVRNTQAKSPLILADLKSVEAVLQQHPDTRKLALTSLLGKAVYRLQGPEVTKLVDAHSGELLSPISPEYAASIAAHYYAGSGAIDGMELISESPPGEVRFLRDPFWRIDFDDLWGSSFYVDSNSGRFITRRHTLWRVFDFLWMLHIMDYDTREDINTPLLTAATLLGFVLFGLGGWLLYFSFGFGRSKS